MYTSTGGGVFISFGDLTDTVKATKEYYSRFPDTKMIFLKWAAIILGGLTLLNNHCRTGRAGKRKEILP